MTNDIYVYSYTVCMRTAFRMGEPNYFNCTAIHTFVNVLMSSMLSFCTTDTNGISLNRENKSV